MRACKGSLRLWHQRYDRDLHEALRGGEAGHLDGCVGHGPRQVAPSNLGEEGPIAEVYKVIGHVDDVVQVAAEGAQAGANVLEGFLGLRDDPARHDVELRAAGEYHAL